MLEELNISYGHKGTFLSVSGKKNVRLIRVMTKTSVLSDKNVPLLCTTPLEISREYQNIKF